MALSAQGEVKDQQGDQGASFLLSATSSGDRAEVDFVPGGTEKAIFVFELTRHDNTRKIEVHKPGS